MKKFVTYTRVSTAEQAKSGLGLEAQERDIGLFLQTQGGEYEIVGQFCDTGSGADDGRPELVKALKLVRKTGAELLVSKLDRLSRDVAMIAGLMKDRDVNFRIATMPSADKFSLHIYAALAEQEREMISLRTKTALKAAKERGVKLGGHREGALEAANNKRIANANERARKAFRFIRPLLDSGLSLRQASIKLNEMELQSPQGGAWTATSVKRLVHRMEGGNGG